MANTPDQLPPIPAPPISMMDNDAMTREMLERQRRQDERLFGDGSTDNPGLVTEVDRLKLKMNALLGLFAAIGTVAIGFPLGWLWTKLTGKTP